MSPDALNITVQFHPSLRPVAFVTRYPVELGSLESPEWLLALLALDVDAPLARSEEVRLAVRDMLRHWGHKPAGRGKPASEYLIRAVDRGELGSINVAVDVCNVVSLHSGFPIALMDADRLDPPLRVGQGCPGEQYVFNPAGQVMDLEGLVCLYDGNGPCANPVKDAQRVKTDDETLETLTVIWGVAGHEARRDTAEAWYRELLGRLGASVRTIAVTMEPPRHPSG